MFYKYIADRIATKIDQLYEKVLLSIGVTLIYGHSLLLNVDTWK